jgi:hypothetical protein
LIDFPTSGIRSFVSIMGEREILEKKRGDEEKLHYAIIRGSL